MNTVTTHPGADVSTAEESLQVFEPAATVVYTIDAIAHIAQVPRHRIAVYCRHGLLSPHCNDNGGFFFGAASIEQLRRIEAIRARCATEVEALKLALGLMQRIDRLQEEVRELRAGWSGA